MERLPQAAHLSPGAVVAAPNGLLDYCARRPEDCGPGHASDLRGLMPATGAATWQNASATHRNDNAVFAAMMAARMSRAEQPPAEASSSVVSLTQARWEELRRINREINRAIRPATDRALFGIEEYWQRPLLRGAAGARGDCEDYALEKRARLLALGYAPDALAMAVAVAPGVGLHAVLIVQTDRGDLVLDNLHGEPRTLLSLNYVWLSRQVGPALSSWAAARTDYAPYGAHTFTDVSAEARFARLMEERLSTSRSNAGVFTPVATHAENAAHVADAAPTSPAPPLKAPDWCLPTSLGGSFSRLRIEHVAP